MDLVMIKSLSKKKEVKGVNKKVDFLIGWLLL